MVTRTPLVLVAGIPAELPVGDTLPGAFATLTYTDAYSSGTDMSAATLGGGFLTPAAGNTNLPSGWYPDTRYQGLVIPGTSYSSQFLFDAGASLLYNRIAYRRFRGGSFSTWLELVKQGDAFAGTTVDLAFNTGAGFSTRYDGYSYHTHQSYHSAGYPTYRFQRALGSAASPTDVTSGTTLGRMSGEGYYNAGWRESGRVEFSSDGAPSGSAVPGLIRLATVNAAGTMTIGLVVRADSSIQHGASARTVVTPDSHLVLRSYTVATLPAATAQQMIFVSNGAGNKRLAVSDGTNWRWPDGTVVS